MVRDDPLHVSQEVLDEVKDPWILEDPDDALENLNYVGPLSYKRVKKYEYVFHPRNRIDKSKFAWRSAEIKYIPLCTCLIKKKEWITNVAREIGLGPSLFLMT